MVEEISWYDCYEDSWKGHIVREAFRHPAKFARGLIRRIVAFGLERGYWRKGDTIGDPFGGVALGGIVAAQAGLCWVGVELEPPFVGLGRRNIELYRRELEAFGDPPPVLLQGDSRGFAALVREQLRSVLTSPPYAGGGEVLGGHNGIDYSRSASGGRKDSPGRRACGENYGASPGQIAKLPTGEADGAITSPPYNPNERSDRTTERRDEKTGHRQGKGCFRTSEAYGTEPGQIGALPAGSLDHVVTSPPYAESIKGDHGERETAEETAKSRRTPGGSLGQSQRHGGYGSTEGNIGNLKEGALDAAITSPPFLETPGGKADPVAGWKTEGGISRPCDSADGYKTIFKDSDTPGQIGAMPAGDLDAAVTSPPFTPSQEQPCASQSQALRDYHAMTRGDGTKYDKEMRSEGNIAQEAPETYWQAMAQVYAQCHLALKPGGTMAVVVKSYVKQGKVVDLPEQTCRLLEALGFEVFLRVRAWLVKETKERTLFGTKVVRKSRKSFFRRLQEKRGAPRIDFEEVIFCRKRAGGAAEAG
jgi:DNA modification methylase